MNGTRTIAIRGSGAIGMRQARVFQSIGARVVVVPGRDERQPIGIALYREPNLLVLDKAYAEMLEKSPVLAGAR